MSEPGQILANKKEELGRIIEDLDQIQSYGMENFLSGSNEKALIASLRSTYSRYQTQWENFSPTPELKKTYDDLKKSEIIVSHRINQIENDYYLGLIEKLDQEINERKNYIDAKAKELISAKDPSIQATISTSLNNLRNEIFEKEKQKTSIKDSLALIQTSPLGHLPYNNQTNKIASIVWIIKLLISNANMQNSLIRIVKKQGKALLPANVILPHMMLEDMGSGGLTNRSKGNQSLTELVQESYIQGNQFFSSNDSDESEAFNKILGLFIFSVMKSIKGSGVSRVALAAMALNACVEARTTDRNALVKFLTDSMVDLKTPIPAEYVSKKLSLFFLAAFARADAQQIRTILNKMPAEARGLKVMIKLQDEVFWGHFAIPDNTQKRNLMRIACMSSLFLLWGTVGGIQLKYGTNKVVDNHAASSEVSVMEAVKRSPIELMNARKAFVGGIRPTGNGVAAYGKKFLWLILCGIMFAVWAGTSLLLIAAELLLHYSQKFPALAYLSNSITALLGLFL